MKLVYTNENRLIVENTKNVLSESGIETRLRNEYLSGGIGELAPMETWPELWVQEAEYEAAKAIVAKLMNAPMGEIWMCGRCKEENEATFEHCWNCQQEKLVDTAEVSE